MEIQNEIQIWSAFLPAINISIDSSQNKLQIEVRDTAIPLPEELEQRVENHWREACSHKKLTDNPVLFLESEPVTDPSSGMITIPTNTRNFRYTHAFNRNPDFHNMIEELNRYSLLSISTHCHIVTKDGKIVFGTKKNQFNQISGFSGFPNIKEDCIEVEGRKYLDIYNTIVNRLRPEIGYLVDAIDSIQAIGITYVDTIGLRGTDSDYILRLDETSDNVQQRFEESSQFAKRLHVVDFNPRKIREFFEQVYADSKEMSKYALGCSYLFMKALFGDDEANKHLETIKKLGINISTSNKTNYFRETC